MHISCNYVLLKRIIFTEQVMLFMTKTVQFYIMGFCGCIRTNQCWQKSPYRPPIQYALVYPKYLYFIIELLSAGAYEPPKLLVLIFRLHILDWFKSSLSVYIVALILSIQQGSLKISQACANLLTELMAEKQTDYRFNLDLIDGCEEEKVKYHHQYMVHCT